MRKEIIRNLVFLCIASALLLTGLIFGTISATKAWLLKNEHIDADSNLIYAINQGYGDDLVSLNNLARVYESSQETVTKVTFIPGDQVYYMFRFSIPVDDYISSKTNYNVDLVIRGEAQEGANSTDGDYLSFLHDCTIEANSCMLAVLSRHETTENDNTIVYYDIVKYHNNNGTYTIDDDGEVSSFSSETTGALVTNAAVTSFCPDEQASSVKANFDLTIPIVSIDSSMIYNDGTNDLYWFMIYVPIKYIDTGVNQNNQMDSTLTINGSHIILR